MEDSDRDDLEADRMMRRIEQRRRGGQVTERNWDREVAEADELDGAQRFEEGMASLLLDLHGPSLVASGGWRVPSEHFYPGLTVSREGVMSFEPEDEDDDDEENPFAYTEERASWPDHDNDEPVEQSEAEHYALAGEVPPPTPPASVIVVGSFAWDNGAAVHGALQQWHLAQPQTTIVLYTSGCPHGAEAHARTYAEAMGWQTIALRDEELVLVPAPAFAFMKDESPGVQRLVDDLRRRTWTRVMRDDTHRVLSLWADR